MSKLNSPKLSTASGTTSKETIYVDVDDEITAIIDKISHSKSTIIALVLPKRATVLQSIVNMKLLKRTSDESNKNLVLVTSEAGLLPLAGIVGLHVASTPTSKPSVPPMPEQIGDEPENIDEPLEVADRSGANEEFDPDAEASTPIGKLAGLPENPSQLDEPDEVTLDNDLPSEKPDVVAVKKNKKLAVPNFDKFRLKVVLGVLLLGLLIGGWVIATKVLPKATVSIETNSQVIRSTINMTLDSTTKKVDLANKILPATTQSTQKSYSQQVATTGQQNKGEKASGKVTLTNCSSGGDPITVPAGTGVSSGGMTYITQANAYLDTSAFTSGGVCKSLSDTSATVNVVALKGGTSYNIGSATFTTSFANVTAKSAAGMTGGTDDIVKIVAQTDIDSAKSKIATQDASALKQDLQSALQGKGLLPVPSTFLAGEQQVTTSSNPGDVADTVTVTSVVPYTMLGIQTTDLKSLIAAVVEKQIDTKKQKILDDGVSKITFSQQSPGSNSTAIVAAKVQSVAGPELKPDELKKQVAGKKSGEIKSSIDGLPGVTDVTVKYSPFWVSSAPKDISKITIDIAQPNTAK